MIAKLLQQEQISKQYQGQLELMIATDSAAHQRLNSHCVQLERKVSSLEFVKSQNEVSLRLATEACQTIANDLQFERTRVYGLESRLADLYPSINRMLEYFSQRGSSESASPIRGLRQENQHLREVSAYLQASLRAREELVQDMRSTLAEAFLGFSENNASSAGLEQKEDVSYFSDNCSSVDIITAKAEPTECDMV